MGLACRSQPDPTREGGPYGLGGWGGEQAAVAQARQQTAASGQQPARRGSVGRWARTGAVAAVI